MAGSENKKDAPHPVPERLLSNLWRKRAARRDWFRTSAGTRMRVLYPGRASSAAGPDFRGALLEVEGLGLVQGDVEIHVRQQDWKLHGHGRDPRYNGVVLHAALEVDPTSTRLQSGQSVPVVSLAPLLSVDPEDDPEMEDAPGNLQSAHLWTVLEGRGFPRPETVPEMGALLDRAGDDRFHSNSARFVTLLKEQDQEQTLYEGILEGLGYHQNRQPFIKLAGRARYAALTQAARRLDPERRSQAIQGWLTALSGLAPRQKAFSLPLTGTGMGPAMSASEWHCFRVRPSNHPLRRIAGAAVLLDRFLEPGLVAGLGLAARDTKPGELTSALCAPGGFGAATACIGTARARDLGVNVVLPFLHGLDLLQGEAGGGRAYLELYRRFGKLQDNDLTREMAGLLLGPAGASLVTTARRQSRGWCTCNAYYPAPDDLWEPFCRRVPRPSQDFILGIVEV
ncbi:MAG: hypothetical protein BZY87_01430 [SAR202 cluster bacterium Io17-Chloro-G6]|nr:MAG: hypothetical protein BZY87_01430 [SAR202 cluster bacterium Io17-Chloro-G6]